MPAATKFTVYFVRDGDNSDVTPYALYNTKPSLNKDLDDNLNIQITRSFIIVKFSLFVVNAVPNIVVVLVLFGDAH